MRLMRSFLAGCIALGLGAGVATAGPLHDAARAADEAAIQKLLDAGADINERDETGATPLFAAALASGEDFEALETMDYLLQRKADYTIRDNRGLTVLHAAAIAGDAESVAYFIGSDGPGFKPIDINDNANELGVTPLIAAATEDKGNVVAYLVMGGADIEIADRNGYTALTRAAQEGNDKIVTMLLRSRAVCQTIDPTWLEDCTNRRAALGLK